MGSDVLSYIIDLCTFVVAESFCDKDTVQAANVEEWRKMRKTWREVKGRLLKEWMRRWRKYRRWENEERDAGRKDRRQGESFKKFQVQRVKKD